MSIRPGQQFQNTSSQSEGSSTSRGMSYLKYSDRAAVLTYRQHFAQMWKGFIRGNFQSPSHAALVFQVDASTAENWWAGANAPQGWVVGRAMADPELRDSAIEALSEAA